MSQSLQPAPLLLVNLIGPNVKSSTNYDTFLNDLHEERLRDPWCATNGSGLVTPTASASPTKGKSAANSPGTEVSMSRGSASRSSPASPSGARPPAVPLLQLNAVLTKGLIKRSRPSLTCSMRLNLGDKDGDNDNEVASAFNEQIREQWSPQGSTARTAANRAPITPKHEQSSFTCPYFHATTNGGIETGTTLVANAMKIAHARLAAIAPQALASSRGATKGASRFSPMRVCQSTLVALVPISSAGGSSTSLALHIPSLTLMTIKGVPITDIEGCKAELELVRLWAERSALPVNENVDAACAPTVQFCGVFPSVKHNALVFAYEYMHHHAGTQPQIHSSSPLQVVPSQLLPDQNQNAKVTDTHVQHLKVIALTLRALKIIGLQINIDCLTKNLSLQMEISPAEVRALLMPLAEEEVKEEDK